MKSSRKTDQRPSMQFYPKDWLSETGLRCVSYAAKGLWIDLLCHMWTAPVRGVLEANALQNLTKLEANDLQNLIGELLKFEVCEKDENSALICRRMYREWQHQKHISEVRSEAGKQAKHQQKYQQNTPSSTPSATPSPSATAKKERDREGSFAPPALADVKEFWSQGEGLRGSPDEFFNYFESKGWVVGGRGKMKNWKAAARNWSLREIKLNPKEAARDATDRRTAEIAEIRQLAND